MKTKIVLNLTLVIAILMAGCTKKPNASFEFNNQSYTAGDTVILTNTSSLGNTYRWTFSTGATSYSKDTVKFVLPDSIPDGTFTVTLEAFSKNRKLVDKIQQTVEISGKKARVLFYSKPLDNPTPIQVLTNYQASYISTFYTDSITGFDKEGVAVFYELPIYKRYSYSAANSIFTPVNSSSSISANSWEGSFYLRNDTIIKLSSKNSNPVNITKAKVMFWCRRIPTPQNQLINDSPISIEFNFQTGNIANLSYSTSPNFQSNGVAVFHEVPLGGSYSYNAFHPAIDKPGKYTPIGYPQNYKRDTIYHIPAESWNGVVNNLTGDEIIELQ